MSKEFEGVWDGTLEAGGQTRKVGLKLSADAGGAAMATLIGQGNLEIPVTTVTIQGNELRLEARAVSGTYQGTLRGSGEIAGEWTQGADRFPVTFKRTASETNKP